jgi:pimeloyl-[acyl-carrier protein] methyl ester esterase
MKIAVNGTELHVEQQGSGPDIVLLHGIAMSSAVWTHQVALLAKTHRVTCIDFRGHGQSAKPVMDYSAALLADDVDATMQQLGIAKAVIMGWSMGATVACTLATRHAARVKALVLVDSTPCLIQRPDWATAIPGEAAQQLGGLIASDYSAGQTAFSGMVAGEGQAAAASFIHSVAMQTPQGIMLACMGGVGGGDYRDEIAALRVPTAVICGENDQVCPPPASEWMAKTLNAKLWKVPGAHAPFYTHAASFNSALSEALQSVASH